MPETLDKKFENTKIKNEILYKSFDFVVCPYFQEKIAFNAKGLEHLKFKKRNHARSRNDQYMRFKLLYLAPEILKLSRTVQGVFERKEFEFNRNNHRNEYKLETITYYEFIAVIKEIRVRVIIKQVGVSPKYFWSIIPYWKKDKNNRRKLFTGNPGED